MRSLLSLSLLLLLPTPPQQDATTTLHVNTKLTVVNVTVTDKAGNPVHGLKPSDFVIKEDGKAQPIKNFDEYGTTVTPGVPAPKLPPGLYTNMPAAAPAKGTVNILLFSRLGRWEDAYYARNQALEYLKTMPEGTRVAVLVIEDHLRVVQNITSDRDLLIGAVDSINALPVGGTTYQSIKLLKHDCVLANEQSHSTVDALRQIGSSYAAVPGRKNLIWFSHGLPWLTNIAYFRAHGLDCLDDDTQQLQAAYGMLSASQVAISSVDPRGLEGPFTSDFMSGQLNQESIRDFAESTGGTAYYNRNDLDAAVAQSITSNSDYYSIAYTPPLVGYDGKHHSISVKVNRAGLQLSYRQGYTSLDLASLNNAITKSAKVTRSDASSTASAQLPPTISAFRADMGHGTPTGLQLLFATRVLPDTTPARPAPLPVQGALNPKLTPSSNKPNKLTRYDVVYSIAANQITLADGPDSTHTASVEFDIVAYGEDGTPLNYIAQSANLSIKPEELAQFQQDGLQIPFQLDLPPGKLFLRVGALDLPSGKYGTLEVAQTVAKPSSK